MVERFDHKAMDVQRGVWDGICSTVGDVQNPLIETHEIVNKNLSLIARNSKREASVDHNLTLTPCKS